MTEYVLGDDLKGEGTRLALMAQLLEPDFLPVSIAEPRDVRAFWDGWLA